jgi:hypothetical protein
MDQLCILKEFDGVELPEGHLTFEDQLLLKKYSIDKKLVVDIGTFKGRSAIIESIYAEKVFTIDYFPNNAPNNFKDTEKNLSKRKNIELINECSWDSAKLFKDKSIDLLVQDGNHSIEGILKDITLFLPKLKNNCIVMIHDFKYQNGEYEDRNVTGGVKYLIENNILKEVEISGWYWVGKIINQGE